MLGPASWVDERNVVAVLVHDLKDDLTIGTGIVTPVKKPEQVVLDSFMHTEVISAA